MSLGDRAQMSLKLVVLLERHHVLHVLLFQLQLVVLEVQRGRFGLNRFGILLVLLLFLKVQTDQFVYSLFLFKIYVKGLLWPCTSWLR